MTPLQFWLTKMAEESSEIAQIALKTQQFGGAEIMPGQPKNNFQRCHLEINDLAAIVEVLNDEFGFGYTPDRAQIEAKKAKVRKYLAYSIQLGMVDASPDEQAPAPVVHPMAQPTSGSHPTKSGHSAPAGEFRVPAMVPVARRKLDELVADGYAVAGVSIERTEDDGSVKRGAVTSGGMVLWWTEPGATRQDASTGAQDVETDEPITLPPYKYGHECGENEKVWDEPAVRQAVRDAVAPLQAKVDKGRNIVRNDMHRAGQYQARIDDLEREVAEADRRAGAAEREKAYAQESAIALQSWLRKAKAEWGADDNVSFDTIWAECLAYKLKNDPICNGTVEVVVDLLEPTCSPGL